MSMRKKILRIFIVSNLLTFFFFAIVIFKSILTEREVKLSQLIASAQNVNDKIDRNLFERYGDVQAFAKSEPARSMDQERIEAFMADMMVAYAPIYDIMIVADVKGHIIAANTVDKNGTGIDNKRLIGLNVAGQEWFVQATASSYKDGTSIVGSPGRDIVMETEAPKDRHALDFSAPIYVGKKLVGVWSNRMSWEDVVETMVRDESKKLIDERITSIEAVLRDKELRGLVQPEGREFGGKTVASILASGKNVGTKEISDGIFGFREHSLVVEAATLGYASYPSQGWSLILRTPLWDPSMLSILLLGLVAGIFIVISVLFSGRFIQKISSKISETVRTSNESVRELRKTVNDLNVSSRTLAKASSDQASAIETSASSVEQMTSMLVQTTAGASSSLQTVEDGERVALESKSVMERMILAMKAIVAQTERLTEINNAMREIESRSKIVNSISFETRLLSFNAQIEAARAGQYGRGFAVVADEVGKLATSSATSASEIRGLLESSLALVSQIAQETVDSVRNGNNVSNEIMDTMKSIEDSLSKIKNSTTSIVGAAKEQESGIRQLNNAMNEMDRIVQGTSKSASDLASMAKNMLGGFEQLDVKIQSLRVMVEGS